MTTIAAAVVAPAAAAMTETATAEVTSAVAAAEVTSAMTAAVSAAALMHRRFSRRDGETAQRQAACENRDD